ncbi:MAG: BTB/POZ domain-containing protein [Candidatus Protochlamydia sp.]|nr:BTB/POZ domain-containing protein [Candidatus Protochlamydia sp.]
MNLYNLNESLAYIHYTAQDLLEDQNAHDEKRRRISSTSTISQKEVTQCNTEQFSEIIFKMMQILHQYPKLLEYQNYDLTTIKNRVKILSPTYETAEFKLFSKMVQNPTIELVGNNGSCKVNTALLYVSSKVIEKKFSSNGNDKLDRYELNQFSGEEIEKAVRLLEKDYSGQIEIDDVQSYLALTDYLDISCITQALEGYFSKIERLTENNAGQIISLLNGDMIDHYPVIKTKLEQLISRFFIEAFENSMEDNYFKIKNTIECLSKPISIDFSNGKMNDFHLAHIEKIPVKSLNLTNCSNLTFSCLHVIKEIVGLEKIILSNNLWVDNKFLEHLPKISTLKGLGLNSCTKITDEGIEHLSDQLVNLHINGCRDVTDRSAVKLGQMAGLKSLELSHTSIGDATVNVLSDGIHNLFLKGCQGVTDGSALKLGQMAGLKNLDLCDTSIGDATVNALSSGIEILVLSGCRGLTDGSADKLGQMAGLKFLVLNQTAIGDATVNALSDGIQRLFLNGCQGVTDGSADKLGQMAGLKTLDLSSTSIGDTTVNFLSNGIEHLDLTGCRGVTDGSAVKLGQMAGLKILALNRTSIGDATVNVLSNGIERLGLRGCRGVTDGSAVKLGQMANLKILGLSHTSIGDATVNALSNVICKLILNGCQRVTNGSAAKLGQMVKLQSLDVRNTLLTLVMSRGI